MYKVGSEIISLNIVISGIDGAFKIIGDHFLENIKQTYKSGKLTVFTLVMDLGAFGFEFFSPSFETLEPVTQHFSVFEGQTDLTLFAAAHAKNPLEIEQLTVEFSEPTLQESERFQIEQEWFKVDPGKFINKIVSGWKVSEDYSNNMKPLYTEDVVRFCNGDQKLNALYDGILMGSALVVYPNSGSVDSNIMHLIDVDNEMENAIHHVEYLTHELEEENLMNMQDQGHLMIVSEIPYNDQEESIHDGKFTAKYCKKD